MKKLFYAFLLASFSSCTNDEQTVLDNNLPATTYSNLTSNNYWKYRINFNFISKASLIKHEFKI